jgi:predicted aspartyl protease
MTDALASPYVAYKLPLTGFRPEGVAQHGLIITARINGGHPLRLVLDTGARGILLYKSAARDLNLEPLVASQVGGLGTGQVVGSTLSLAKTIAFGDLQFRDCLVHVSNRDISPEADGVLAPSLFEQFLVRIDPKAKAIQLSPRIEMETPEAHRALNLDKLLLVRGEMACDREGWFLLDTGAAFTAMGASTIAQGARTAVDMVGAQGSAGAFRVAPIAVKVGGRSLTDPEAIALDLAGLSQREGVEIAGILGYSALSRWPVTIDYRSGLVRIGDPK